MKIRPLTEKLMKRDDIAKFLQVTTRTVDNLRNRGLPTIMVGASPRFDVEAVKLWLRAEKLLDDAETSAENAALSKAISGFADPNRVRLQNER